MPHGSVLGVIPARAGSKGIPRKNVVEVGGRPLVCWTFDAALAASMLDRVILSSDDQEVIGLAKASGIDVPFVRPKELAGDAASGVDVARHALEALDEAFDLIVYLQPTSPLRTAEDIDAAIRLCSEGEASSCVSVTPARKSPYWMYTLGADGSLTSLLGEAPPQRRQDAPPVYVLNGAVYVARVEWLKEHGTFVGPGTIAYVMPEGRSVDLDGPEDLEYVRSKFPR